MNHAFDVKALELSRQAIALFFEPMPGVQLQAKIQNLFIAAMEFAAPAVQAEQQEPVSQPYTLPECFERLFKHAQGLTFGNDWNRGTAAKYHRDLLIKTVDDCRGAIASGNYPAIPDYWTGSDKANAALVMLDRIDTLDPVDDDRIEGIKRIIRELAAAPKQEVKAAFEMGMSRYGDAMQKLADGGD